MSYQPVVTGKNATMRGTALVGMHSVVLGFDFLGSRAERRNFLGFAIHRTDLTDGEGWWLSGQIRFKRDPGDFGEDVPTNRGPIQKFRWGDYTAKPGHDYRYAVHPVFGTPGALDIRAPVVLEITTAVNSSGVTGIHFNRGVTAALAYRRRFGDVPPEKVADGAAHRWLSRGLEEALLDFIGEAGAGDELKVAIYEFEHEAVIKALKAAKARGVRIRLVYHAKAGDKQTGENWTHVKSLGLPASRISARRNVPNISHNKFIVHLTKNSPNRVWTGSTNFTEAGLFLQTNVGLMFRETSIARAFDGYFELLRQDLETKEIQAEIATLLARSRRALPRGRTLYFSPVRGVGLLEAAVDLVSHAKDVIFTSCPFGLDRVIIDALNANKKEVLEYGLVNTTNRKKLITVIDRSVNSWYATPAWLKKYDGRLWDAKAYGNHKIHVKSLVVDPWGERPRLLIGSANFSDESVQKNDENALLLEGDGRAAAIVATEFLRMFDHYKFRDYVKRAEKTASERYLAEDGSWTADYFDPSKAKYRDRAVFAGSDHH